MLTGNALALQYTTSGQTVVQVGSNILLYILGWLRLNSFHCLPPDTSLPLLDRANAYQFWVLHPPASSGALPQYSTTNPIIVKGGYLLRSVSVDGSSLALVGDLNSTANFEIVAPAAQSHSVTFNASPLSITKTSYGTLTASKAPSLPAVTLPTLSALTWVSDQNSNLSHPQLKILFS